MKPCITSSVCFGLPLLIISTAFWVKHEYIPGDDIDPSWYKPDILQRLSEVRPADGEDRQLTTYTRQLTTTLEACINPSLPSTQYWSYLFQRTVTGNGSIDGCGVSHCRVSGLPWILHILVSGPSTEPIIPRIRAVEVSS